MENQAKGCVAEGQGLLLFKLALARAAQRANPIFGKRGPQSAGGDSILGDTGSLIIDKTTHRAYVLFHSLTSLINDSGRITQSGKG